MKRLHEALEEHWEFQGLAVMDGVIREVDDPKQVILLLHGLNERGRRIFRRLLPYLPDNALVIAPNGPFPIPRVLENEYHYGFSWYFYDRFKKTYFINQDLARSWLVSLMGSKNPRRLPLTIIGFSQGGYLAPLIGGDLSETRKVIGIACEFKTTLIEAPVPFELHAVHGSGDTVITPESAMRELILLKEKGIHCHWHLVEEAAHEISSPVGETIRQILETDGKRSL
jgi:predicted esterase